MVPVQGGALQPLRQICACNRLCWRRALQGADSQAGRKPRDSPLHPRSISSRNLIFISRTEMPVNLPCLSFLRAFQVSASMGLDKQDSVQIQECLPPWLGNELQLMCRDLRLHTSPLSPKEGVTICLPSLCLCRD